MKDQYKHMADFCRSKIDGGPNDARWKDLAAHWDRLHESHSQRQKPQQPQGKPPEKN